MEVSSFDEIAEEFERRVRRAVWATVTTVDRQGRPRSRVMHPVWEGSTGWAATRPGSLKTRHLAVNPFVSVTYFDAAEAVYVDCKAEGVDDVEMKRHAWTVMKGEEPPYGYDPGTIWPEGPEHVSFGVLKLTPWRLELYVPPGPGSTGPLVWRPGER